MGQVAAARQGMTEICQEIRSQAHPSAAALKDWQRPTGDSACSLQMPAVVSASSIAFVPPASAASASPFARPCSDNVMLS